MTRDNARIGPTIGWSQVTPRADYLNRRQIMAGALGLGLAGLAGPAAAKLDYVPSKFSTDETPNTLEEITSYNNFYEFGTGKSDPMNYSGQFQPEPWTVEIGGLVDKPGTWGLDDVLKGITLEERIYRLRCVEAWSMVIPWIGFPLSALLEKAGPQPGARYVAFETVVRPEEMPGQRARFLDWPYREGLRMDEAMHPLTILATGLYGEELPNQNGAPLRLVVPWKYGFKGIKSIVKITLVADEPPATWKMLQSNEYGFYANVNPKVDHPRWSQATERRIGAGLFGGRQETQMFNGYGDQVADLYKGMDLAKFY
ncbi:protein-methionine-sulfoxide reductase catalytic subunit MsrP [Frigidibacter sp. MR17.24]|uniref:protein-methionine-sulfoxide reductase catalytic subunit MsrP n=1 Tax=Frigidibacter sp. MR17.24 TaxID=3127345 RepID=UPI003012B1A9